MIINCTINKEIEKGGKFFYCVKDNNNNEEHIIPVSQFQKTPVEIEKTYRFLRKYNQFHKKYYLSIISPNLEKYGIGETYPLIIKGYSKFMDKKQNTFSNSIIVELGDSGIERQVRAYEWHKESLWKFEEICCKVVSFSESGIPELVINDNRHPVYILHESYEFEIISFRIKTSSKTDKTFKIIDVKDKYNCYYEVLSLPYQEDKLKQGDIIECKIQEISTRLKLSQVNVNDPFFYKFEDIIKERIFKSTFFSTQLNIEGDLNSITLSNQYDSKSAFWVFTYCNLILPNLFHTAIQHRDYKQSLEINSLLIVFEKWILSSSILRAFSSELERKETKKKVELVIKRLSIRDMILPYLEEMRSEEFLKQQDQINILEVYEYFFLDYFPLIDAVKFVEIIENISKIDIIDEDRFYLSKLSSSIENKKKFFITEIKDDYFVLSKKLSTEHEIALNKYFVWSYCQYLIYDYISQPVKKNLISGQLLRYFVHSTSTFQYKEQLLYNAFYILSNNKATHSMPFFMEGGNIKVDFKKFNKNPNISNNQSNWDEIIKKIETKNVHKVNIVEKIYKGYKIELLGVNGFLPIRNISDNSLKRNPFKNISWETNVEIHLYSKEFNFFVARQFESRDPDYYSLNSTANAKIGDVIYGKISHITDYGVFLITPYGDGLLHINNISEEYWDKQWLNKYFIVGKYLYVKIINIENNKIDLGFMQLVDTEYEIFYNNFLFGGQNVDIDLDNSPDVSEDTIDKGFELEKGFVFEQFAVIQESFNNKVEYIKLAKQFFANTQNARSYLHNIYISYFNSINDLNDLIKNYSFEKYNEFRTKINLIKGNIDSKTLEIFSESENLIFFINILSLFNVNTDESNSELMDYIKKYSLDDSKQLLKILAKTTLANNLLISEVQKNDNQEGLEFSLKNLKRIRHYIQNGIFSLSETEEDRLDKELREKISYWREKIKLDEGEKLEFKATFIVPVPGKDKLRIVSNLEEQLRNSNNEKTKESIKRKIDDIKGLTAQKIIIHSALKSIAAFANTNGGILMIGVANDKEIYGLEKDYDYFKKVEEKNRDGFGKFFDAKIKEYFGNSFSSIHLGKEFLKFPEGDVLIIEVKPSTEEVFLLKDETGTPTESLYIRNLSSSEKLEGSELAKFIRKKLREQLN